MLRRYETERETPHKGQRTVFAIEAKAKLEPPRRKNYGQWSFPVP